MKYKVTKFDVIPTNAGYKTTIVSEEVKEVNEQKKPETQHVTKWVNDGRPQIVKNKISSDGITKTITSESWSFIDFKNLTNDDINDIIATCFISSLVKFNFPRTWASQTYKAYNKMNNTDYKNFDELMGDIILPIKYYK